MSTRLDRVTEQYKEKFPHMKEYAACQSRAFMMGMVAFLTSGSCAYLAQEVFKSKIPYSFKYHLIPPIAVGVVSAYGTTMYLTHRCQQMWMAVEEKHSVITPLKERLDMKKENTTPESPSSSSPLQTDHRLQ